jgi:hypothetical protein
MFLKPYRMENLFQKFSIYFVKIHQMSYFGNYVITNMYWLRLGGWHFLLMCGQWDECCIGMSTTSLSGHFLPKRRKIEPAIDKSSDKHKTPSVLPQHAPCPLPVSFITYPLPMAHSRLLSNLKQSLSSWTHTPPPSPLIPSHYPSCSTFCHLLIISLPSVSLEQSNLCALRTWFWGSWADTLPFSNFFFKLTSCKRRPGGSFWCYVNEIDIEKSPIL